MNSYPPVVVHHSFNPLVHIPSILMLEYRTRDIKNMVTFELPVLLFLLVQPATTNTDVPEDGAGYIWLFNHRYKCRYSIVKVQAIGGKLYRLTYSIALEDT